MKQVSTMRRLSCSVKALSQGSHRRAIICRWQNLISYLERPSWLTYLWKMMEVGQDTIW